MGKLPNRPAILGLLGAKLPLNCPSKQKRFSKAEVPHAWRVTAGAWLWSQWPLSLPAWALSFQGPGGIHCNLSHSLSCSVRSSFFHTDLCCEHSTVSNQWAAPGKPLLHANCIVSLQTPTNTDALQQPDSETQSGPYQSLNQSLERSKPIKQKPGVVICKILAKAASANFTNLVAHSGFLSCHLEDKRSGLNQKQMKLVELLCVRSPPPSVCTDPPT